MHTFQAPSGRTYYHNGDFSGNVVIDQVASCTVNEVGDLAIPFEDIRALYLEFHRRQQIGLLETATYDELERWAGEQ